MEIKPCPFCGSTQILIERGVTDDRGKKRALTIAFTIYCAKCYAMFRYFGKNAYNTLIERWNRRSSIRH
jgi:Lar family restriction alleviation protein